MLSFFLGYPIFREGTGSVLAPPPVSGVRVKRCLVDDHNMDTVFL